MPNTGKYRIEINVNGDDNNSVSNDYSPNVAGTQGEGASNNSIKNLAKKVSTAYGYTAVGRQIFNYQVSRIGAEQGNTLKQQKWEAGLSLANMAFSTAMGFALGGAVGGGLMLLSNAIGIAQQYNTYGFEKNWENIGLQEARKRAGASYNRSRTEGR